MEKYKKENFINRELSWIQFNWRVLEEAIDKNNPLFEKLIFLSITASNLDEFLMVRVGSLVDLVRDGYTKKDFSGLTPLEQLVALGDVTKKFMYNQYKTWENILKKELKENGIDFVKHHEELTDIEKEYTNKLFKEEIYPVLTPMAVDGARPFPLIQNRTINIGALVTKRDDGDIEFVTVQVPSVLPRLIELPMEDENSIKRIILLEEVIEMNISKLFEKYTIVCAHPYRVTRNADMEIDEDDVSDLLKEVERQIKKRRWGEILRLEIEDGMDQKLRKFLLKKFSVGEDSVLEINGPLDLTFLSEIYKLEGYEKLKYKPFSPQTNPRFNTHMDIFENIKKGDILLSHPYESFEPVIDFIKSAAEDPNVLAIKQTLYRVSGKSPIIAALETAALNGKQVTVLVELKARFDEENNIVWAKKLERAGCHVIYGLKGLKTHSKITLVVRREASGIKAYVHLGTGNYNDSTAKLYTDMGILTCSKEIGEDAIATFNMISGYSEPNNWNSLIVAPLCLRSKIKMFIQRETENALNGKKAKIEMKMNSLCDKEVMEALYNASKAGVKIKLIVRGICCLRAGVPGLSENIRVRSIVGRFLEHSRIYYFYNDGEEEIYMSSADLMPRNLNRRVEIMFPIYDSNIKEELKHHMNILFKDNVKAREMKDDGTYAYAINDRELVGAQEYFMKEAIKRNVSTDSPMTSRRFVPMTSNS